MAETGDQNTAEGATASLFLNKFAFQSKFASKLFQLSFIVVGVLITLYVFFNINDYVRSVVQDQYDREAQQKVEFIAQELTGVKDSFSLISNVLKNYKGYDRTLLASTAQQYAVQFQNFDQILWLYQNPSGKWGGSTILSRDSDASDQEYPKSFSIKVDKDVLIYLTEKALIQEENISFHTDLKFIATQTKQAAKIDVKAEPFALIKAVEPNNPRAGFLIAVGNLAPVLQDTIQDIVSEIYIKELKTGYRLYEAHFEKEDKALSDIQLQAFEFRFLGSPWEIKTSFSPNRQILFMRSLPVFVLLIGFAIICIGALYLYDVSKKRAQISVIQDELNSKAQELAHAVRDGTLLNEALSQAEKENRAIIDAVSDIIFEINTEGIISFLSASWQKVTGFELEQSTGLEFFTMLHNEDQDIQRKDFQLMVRGQKPAYRSFARLRTSNGTFRAVELAFSMMRQDKNKNLRIVGTITDVEERRRAERALSEAEKKYRAIVENAAGGIYQITPEGLYLSANPSMARILGYESPEELLKNVKDANATIYADPQERDGFIRELEKRGSISNYETEVVQKDGTKIWVNENVRVVRDDSGAILYFEGSLEDITIRKKSDLAMRDAKVHSDLANRAKSEFLANMSHELRTPLNAIIGFSEIIKDEVFGPIGQNAYQEYAKDIYQSGKNLLQIINEILDISKIEAGNRQLNESVIDLDTLVEGCLELIHNKIEANKMTVTNTLEGVPQIIGEELAIKQILMNLLSNAIKFTPAGGRVTISAELDHEQQLRLSITDTGIGLDQEEVRKALSPFGQIDNELSRSGSGTGLGLTLVDALTKLHGGEFELFSQKGIGTTATLIFPKDRVTVKKSTRQKSEDSSDAETV